MTEPRIADNPQQNRYEVHLDGELAAQAQYQLKGDTIVFTHTEVDPRYEGKGLGSKLAQFALKDVQGRKLKVVAQCKFIAAYIERHPEYQALLAR